MATDPHIPTAEDLRELVTKLATTHMPFGKFGPENYPPKGRLIMDLPQEYLAWFYEHGFPKGELGYLLQQCLLIKGAGLDALFAPYRKQRKDKH